MSTDEGWIAVQPHIVGNLATWSTCYDWDGDQYATRSEAVDHGFEAFGSDDFNVGKIEHNRLVWWGWMDEPLLEDLESAAAGLGLLPPASVGGL